MTKLIKGNKKFIVETKYQCEGYESLNAYEFDDFDSMHKFINGESYPSLKYYEIIQNVYSKVEYEIEYKDYDNL